MLTRKYNFYIARSNVSNFEGLLNSFQDEVPRKVV